MHFLKRMKELFSDTLRYAVLLTMFTIDRYRCSTAKKGATVAFPIFFGLKENRDDPFRVSWCRAKLKTSIAKFKDITVVYCNIY